MDEPVNFEYILPVHHLIGIQNNDTGDDPMTHSLWLIGYEVDSTNCTVQCIYTKFLIIRIKKLEGEHKKLSYMEPLNILYIADTTISGGTFQTPILQNITHGQRNNSRLWHTREDNGLPFHYCAKKVSHF